MAKIPEAFKAVNFSMSQSVHVSLMMISIKNHVVHLPTVQQNFFIFVYHI